MPKFLIKSCYTAEGAKGLQKDGGTGRRAAVEKVIGSVGGKVDSFYFAYGDVDAYVIVDLPDQATAIALSTTVNASGAVKISTVPLITPEEMDLGTKKSIAYRPPGA